MQPSPRTRFYLINLGLPLLLAALVFVLFDLTSLDQSIIVLLGLIYGTTRVLQGWHFMSYMLWAGIFVWLTTWLTALCCYGRPALQGWPALTPTPRPARLPALSGWHMASRVIDTRLMRFKHKGQQ